LDSAGFSTAPFKAVTDPKNRTQTRVFLTIDDGFKDIFKNALPVLTKHRFRAVLFLVSDLLGKTNEWQQRAGDIVEPLMDESEIRGWLDAGQEIGSHTQTHPRLTQLSREAARKEVTASKKSLEDRFGAGIDHFCYPYGDWNEAVRDLVAEAGYKTACTTVTGINSAETSRFELKRVTARYPSRNLKAIWSRLRGSLS
jgi:peptidoglycan/xylan/chitin deacetylase (PgdA/CDA1 family)